MLNLMTDKRKIVWLSDARASDYSAIEESRHYVVFPYLISCIQQRTPSSVLDYGGGDGRFLGELRERFEGALSYYDPSESLAVQAKARLRNASVQFYSSPQSFLPGQIDVVTSIAVWMTIGSHEGCLEYLRQQHRVLRPGGVALIAVTHPCFREEKYSTFDTDFDNRNYSAAGVPVEVNLFDASRRISLKDYHWNLSTMIAQARAVGFNLMSLAELPDRNGGNPRGAAWMCFEFSKNG